MLVKNHLVGFSIDQLHNDQGEPITVDQINALSEYGVTLPPKKLYNYALLLDFLWIGLCVFYLVYYGKPHVSLFGSTYIKTYYVILLMGVLIGVTHAIHLSVLNRICKASIQVKDTTNS